MTFADRVLRAWLPRTLHPAAWWVWAICLCIAASGTSNPLLLALIIAVATVVVIARRDDGPWATSFRLYATLGAFVVVVRVIYRLLFGGGDGSTVLITLPTIPLPQVTAGLRLLGPVTLEALLAGFYDGLRLATIIVVIGAANSLANPLRLLASLPSALYEIGTVLVVAVTVFPQLGASLQRVRRARRLRATPGKGRRQRLGFVRGIIVPVLTDALDSAVSLAASMDARGFGRVGDGSPRLRRLVTAAILIALVAFSVGVYCYLTQAPPAATIAAFALAIGSTALGFIVSGRQVRRTKYRPPIFGVPEILVIACGLAAPIAVAVVAAGPLAGQLNPQLLPVIEWPALPPVALAGILIALLPAVLAPRPPREEAA